MRSSPEPLRAPLFAAALALLAALPARAADTYTLTLFNVDDTLSAYLTNASFTRRPVLAAGYGETKSVDLTPFLAAGANQVILELLNSGGGYTYGFELSRNGVPLSRGGCGEVGVFGCDDNSFATGIVVTRTLTIDVSNPCPSTLAPNLAAISPATSGQSMFVAWSLPDYDLFAPTLQVGGTFLLETSTNGFSTVDATYVTSGTSFLVPTSPSASSAVMSFRVRSRQPCGAESPRSSVVQAGLAAAPASFVITRAPEPIIVVAGGNPPSTRITLRNVGGVPGTVQIRPPGFLSASASSVTVPAQGERTVTLSAAVGTGTTAEYEGTLSVATSAGTLYAPVRLYVISAARRALHVSSETTRVSFVAPEGTNPAPQTIRVPVQAGPGDTYEFLPTTGPGGAWLAVTGGSFDRTAQVFTLQLSVDRGLASAEEGPLPRRTILKLIPVVPRTSAAVDTAYVEVTDSATIEGGSGAGARSTDGGGGGCGHISCVVPPSGGSSGTSFIVPLLAPTSSSGAAIRTDGFLRNIASTAVGVTLFFTPQGANGLTDPSVQKRDLTIAAGTTFRLASLAASAFGGDAAGQLEVRPSSGSLQALSLRTLVERTENGDASTRVTAEIPFEAFGAGFSSADPPVVFSGVEDDGGGDTDLVLFETIGAAADVEVSIRDDSGTPVGTRTLTVPAYGSAQIPRVARTIAASVAAGTVQVRVANGSGRVASLALASGGGRLSAIAGTPVDAASTSARRTAHLGAGAAPSPLAATGLRWLFPGVRRTQDDGKNLYTTDVSLKNVTAGQANLLLTYRYVDEDRGVPGVATKSVSVPPRLPFDGTDLVASAFGLKGRSYGLVSITGDVSALVLQPARSAVRKRTAPSDPTVRPPREASLDPLYASDARVLGRGEAERHYIGAERTALKGTALEIAEVAGASCRVRLRSVSSTGAVLSERQIDLAANQYLRLADLFGSDGLGLPDAQIQNVDVSVQVVAGDGRVLAEALVTDAESRATESFALQPAGPTF